MNNIPIGVLIDLLEVAMEQGVKEVLLYNSAGEEISNPVILSSADCNHTTIEISC